MPQRNRFLVFTAALFALLLVAAACGSEDSTTAAPTGSQTNPELPEQFFSAPTVGGGQIDLGDLDGQDVVLWFWAPW